MLDKMSDSIKQAQQAAAKVNAMLVGSGHLEPSELKGHWNKGSKTSDLFIEEVVINDAPMSARNFLTRSCTQDEISKMSGAAVSTRGRYMSRDELNNPNRNPNEHPLYLHIQAKKQQDVKVAVGRIMHIILDHTHRKNQGGPRPRGPRPNPAPGLMGPRPGSRGIRNHQDGPRASLHKNRESSLPPSNNTTTSSSNNNSNNSNNNNNQNGNSQVTPPQPAPNLQAPPANVIREKVFIPVNIGLDPNEIRIRVLGENSRNLRYIQEVTGVNISLRGNASSVIPSGQEGQETLFFFLEHTDQEKFNEAKSLVVNLTQTVIGDLQQQQQQQVAVVQQQQVAAAQQQQQTIPLFEHPPPHQPTIPINNVALCPPPRLDSAQPSVTIPAEQSQVVPQIPPPVFIQQPASGTPQLTAQIATQPPPQVVPNHIAPPQILSTHTASRQMAPSRLTVTQNPPPLDPVGVPQAEAPPPHLAPTLADTAQLPPQIPPPQTAPPLQPHLVQQAVMPPPPINALSTQMNPQQISGTSTALVLTPQVVQAVPPIVTQAVVAQPVTDLLQTSGPTHQVVHINPATITQPPPSQQLVQTSSGPQLVQLPPGTQIISTADGPRLVAIQTPTSLPTSIVHHTLTAQPPPISSVPDPQLVAPNIENIQIQEQQSVAADSAHANAIEKFQPNGSVQYTSVTLMMPASVVNTSNALISSAGHSSLEVTYTQSHQEPRVQHSVVPPTGIPQPVASQTVQLATSSAITATVNSGANVVLSATAPEVLSSEPVQQINQQYYYNPLNQNVPPFTSGTSSAPPTSGASQVYTNHLEHPQPLLQEQVATVLPPGQALPVGHESRKEGIATDVHLRPHTSEASYNYEGAVSDPNAYHNKVLEATAQQGPIYQQVQGVAVSSSEASLEGQWNLYGHSVKSTDAGQQQYDPYTATIGEDTQAVHPSNHTTQDDAAKVQQQYVTTTTEATQYHDVNKVQQYTVPPASEEAAAQYNNTVNQYTWGHYPPPPPPPPPTSAEGYGSNSVAYSTAKTTSSYTSEASSYSTAASTVSYTDSSRVDYSTAAPVSAAGPPLPPDTRHLPVPRLPEGGLSQEMAASLQMPPPPPPSQPPQGSRGVDPGSSEPSGKRQRSLNQQDEHTDAKRLNQGTEESGDSQASTWQNPPASSWEENRSGNDYTGSGPPKSDTSVVTSSAPHPPTYAGAQPSWGGVGPQTMGMDPSQPPYPGPPFHRPARPMDWDGQGPERGVMGSYGYNSLPGPPFLRGPRPDNWDHGMGKDRGRGRHFGRGFRDRRF